MKGFEVVSTLYRVFGRIRMCTINEGGERTEELMFGEYYIKHNKSGFPFREFPSNKESSDCRYNAVETTLCWNRLPLSRGSLISLLCLLSTDGSHCNGFRYVLWFKL